jgi:transglutaminase-like putative cysteine protease
VDVEASPGVAVDGPLQATLVLNPGADGKVASLREWFPGARAGGGAVSVALPGRAPAGASRPAAAQRGPTFFVDYDQPGAALFRAALAERLGAAPGDAELARFVDGWIVKKAMTRGLDAAARVAARREGDCTEHAVLLAAAGRLAGRPSRVVLGLALLPVNGALRAFGHAWAELHDGEAWRTVDAAPLPAGVRYLPFAVLDEGPGQLAAAWAALSPVDVRKVILTGAR